MNDEANERFLKIESRLKALETRDQHISETVDSNTEVLERNTRVLFRIERAVIGEEKAGSKGLVKKNAEHDQRIESLEMVKNKWVFWFSGAAFAGTAIFWLLHEIFRVYLSG